MRGPSDERGKGLILSGVRMEVDIQTNTMKILKDVKASKTLNSGSVFEIESGGARFSGQDRQASFYNDVSITVGFMRIQGPEATFEYGVGDNFLRSVVLRGGVKVSDSNKYATSDTVQFDPEQNRFTFKGRPRVVQNGDEITGEEIVFIDGGKKVKVEKIRARMEKNQQ